MTSADPSKLLSRAAPAHRAALPTLPGELDRTFRLIAFDWDGTAVTSRTADATRVAAAIDALLAAGARVAVVTGTNFGHVAKQLAGHIHPSHARRLFVSTNRGSEVFGFDRRGAPVLLWERVATPAEEAALTATADDVKQRIERITGLPIRIVYDRKNRRKIDVIPEPRWADPPKSMIGELLAAVEARLRGAGLRSGLREVFEITETLARDHGLDARVTSDVKHIEVGLTDKADAMSYLLREIGGPLGIAPADVLILGDEFGPIAGFEGSDHKMLGLPEVNGAVVVSVGPEPGGAPPQVLHVGGGPERFCAVLEHQLAHDERLGAFAPPRDGAWVVEEEGFDLAREHEIESLLAIANGYVGSRGSLAEGSHVSRPATYLAGAFERSADVSPVPELLIVPDWGRLRFTVEGSPFGVEATVMTGHRRMLDLRRGLLLREGVGRAPSGHLTQIRTLQVASLADRHLLLEGVELTPRNYGGVVGFEALLDGDVVSASGASHWVGFEAIARKDGALGATLLGESATGLRLALSSHVTVTRAGTTAPACRVDAGPTWVAERCELPVRLGEPVALHRTVSIYSTRDVDDPRAAAEGLEDRLQGRPLSALVDRHAAAWQERWRDADVTIDGAPALERALRFALYHLIASANPADPRTSIGARALAGEAYRGHVFWDTEIFMVPFFVHCWPEAGRALLRYRHLTLDGARRKAQKLGYAGALYAWESADTGDETTPDYIVCSTGQVVRVLSGIQEQHISADVAYALWAYEKASGDSTFARREGLEILIETARFWASRVSIDEAGVAHIREVIGPDEYHEGIDDNAYTNWLARHNLRCAAEAATQPWAREIAGKVSLDPSEPARWRDVAARMYLGLDPATGLIEQFAGFHRLEHVDLAAFSPRTVPMDVLLGRERAQRSDVVKQADVVQLLALLWDELSEPVRRANFLHYEPRTGHGSSLSPGTHALVAARLGMHRVAERYLHQTASIDLGNNMGNSAGGVHAAGLGGFWQAVVMGVGGVRHAPGSDEALILEPNLLPGWRHLGFPIRWRGRAVRVDVTPGEIEVGVEGTEALPIRLGNGPGAALLAEPGRRYAARLTGDGPRVWEEIR